MSTSLKISANTSEVKKSLLDLSRDVKSIGKTKISIFSEADRKFVKGELGRELGLMKTRLTENRAEIGKLVAEQSKLEKNSKAELEQRKKIISAYQTQTKLAQQMDRLQKQSGALGRYGGMGSMSGGGGVSGIAGLIGKVGTLMGAGVLAVGGLALVKGYQASNQFVGGAKNRVKLRGLGAESMNMGSPEELANAGLTEQELIQRQIQTVSRLGRAGGSRESVLQQAKFERSYGLEEGAMANVSTSLRSSFGGKGADEAQMKLQASILASGIEDALGPYLESATELLSEINKNGVTNTDQMINVFSQLVKDGQRTPEQIAESFKTLDAAVKGATGEASTFIQTAFARGGIGGGTVGATKLAMSSGGIFGLNPQELAKRGYNPELIKNMQGAGFMQGVGGRSGALLNQFKTSAGMGKGQNIGDVSNLNTMVGLSSMANSVLGTQGTEGFDALKMMEQVQNKQMTQKKFEEKLQEMRDKKDPSLDRLNKINNSLEGQTDILRSINTNLMEALGKSTVKVANAAVEGENALVQGTGNVSHAITDNEIMDSVMSGAKSLRQNLFGGGLGEKLYDFFNGDDAVSKEGNIPGASESGSASQDLIGYGGMADAVEKGMTRAMTNQKSAVIQNNNNIKVKVQNSDGTVSEKTHN